MLTCWKLKEYMVRERLGTPVLDQSVKLKAFAMAMLLILLNLSELGTSPS